MRRLADHLLDNPLLTKHVRSRLRPGQALPLGAIVLVLCASIVWAGVGIRWIGDAIAVILLLGLQILILAFSGANQLNASLGGARESGILAFHRVSPLPPGTVALGFFLGAPIREYALTALTLPFALFAAYHIDPSAPGRGFLWLAQLEIALFLTTWVVHALAMLGCLTRKKPRGSIQGTVVTVFLLLFFGSYGSIGFYFGATWLLEESLRLNFFGFMIPGLAWLLLYELPLLLFLGLAIVRKIETERAHSFTKPQALACMATLTVLVLGGIWKVARLIPETYQSTLTNSDIIMLAVAYGLAFVAIILALTITPTAGEYVKGVRRALRAGRRRPDFWSDAGSNRVALFALCGLVLAGASAAVGVVGQPPTIEVGWGGAGGGTVAKLPATDPAWLQSRQELLSRPIAIAVLTVAYFGLAHQFFALRAPRSGTLLMSLFIFVAWFVPLLAGALVGVSTPAGQAAGLMILALSPLPGIAMSTGLGDVPASAAIQLAALAPAITFAFVFKYLLVVTQRTLDRELQVKPPSPAVAEPGEKK